MYVCMFQTVQSRGILVQCRITVQRPQNVCKLCLFYTFVRSDSVIELYFCSTDYLVAYSYNKQNACDIFAVDNDVYYRWAKKCTFSNAPYLWNNSRYNDTVSPKCSKKS